MLSSSTVLDRRALARAWKGDLAIVLCGALVCLGLAVALPDTPYLLLGAALAFAGVALFLIVEASPGRVTALLAIYLGLVDGALRLVTGMATLTLVRDVLIILAAAAMLVRATGKPSWPRTPPLTVWLVALVGLVCVQVLNPLQASPAHGIAAIRQHVEFIPFFFFGFLAVRSRGALRTTLAIMVILAAVNGAVGYIQFTMTPDQLSSWGAGYERILSGSGALTSRVFTDAVGAVHVRPPALGSDLGFGANMGALAIAPLLALTFVLPARRRLWLIPIAVGIVAAVVTGQSRSAVIAAVVAAVAYTAFVTSGRRAVVALVSLLCGIVVTWLVVGAFTANFAPGLFDRYSTIGPSKVLSTTQEDRGGSIGLLDDYIRDYPLGAGLGSGGPAVGFFAKPSDRPLNSETEFNFLVIELGIPGLVLLLSFVVRLLTLSLALRQEADPETRLLLAAIAAPLVAMFATWFSGTPTATVPGGPFLWFSAGVLVWWLHELSPRKPRGRELC